MAKDRLSAAMRAELRERARRCCEYCRSPDEFSSAPFSAEHIVPRIRGGATSPENLAWSCPGCNAHKHKKVEGWDAAAGSKAPLFHPRTQRWREHFAWSDDLTVVLGTTPAGRATVEALKLNRDPVVRHRRVLVAAGLHPPPESA